MRIGASTPYVNSAATEPRAPASNARQVDPERTSVTRADLRGAIGRAYQKVTGQAPSSNVLDMLTAHASLETGSGAQMYNFNFGGIKGKSPTGETARCRTKEVFDGKEVEVRDGFRAYRSLDDGALDYVRLMRDRFGGAVSKAESGDVDGFAHALKQAHYYTADESKYASALRHLSGVADTSKPSAASALSHSASARSAGSNQNLLAGLGGLGLEGAAGIGDASSPFPSTVELSRVMDAIGHHRVTEKDDDEE